MVNKEQTIDLLETLARLLELKGENPFKIRAYLSGARALETFSGNFNQLVEQGKLTDLDGIGDAIAKKITEYVTTGKLAYYDELRTNFPDSIFELFELQGLGGKKIKLLWEQLRVQSIVELAAACRDGRVAELAGFGAKTAVNLLKAIEQRARHSGRFLISEALRSAQLIVDHFENHPDVLQISPAGSLRRSKETIGDLDILVATNAPVAAAEHFLKLPELESVLAKGATKTSIMLKNGMQADLRVVTNGEFPFALAYFTGSKEHNVALRGRALQHGWTLNEYRLAEDPQSKRTADSIPAIQSEADLYRSLGLDYIPPELREGAQEIAAAETGRIPRLIELMNLRGAFHNHTSATDGRNTLEEMTGGARELGLQYLGIADHSKSSFQAHGLSEEQLLAQIDQIRALNQAGDDEFQIFAGVECDILKDGSLDFADEVLARLDYVVASVHAVFTLSELEMTKRIIRAIENPYVTMLGHCTGRMLLSREPYAVDVSAVIRAAAATKTVVELNANPHRLDLDWRYWKEAKELGVLCSINPDAHSVQGLQDLRFGVQAARKGWLTKEDVLNTLPLSQVRLALQRKIKRDL